MTKMTAGHLEAVRKAEKQAIGRLKLLDEMALKYTETAVRNRAFLGVIDQRNYANRLSEVAAHLAAQIEKENTK